VPKHVELKEFEELNEAIKTYSSEEDAQIDRELHAIQGELAEVPLFFMLRGIN
jgi:hypothetical protein